MVVVAKAVKEGLSPGIGVENDAAKGQDPAAEADATPDATVANSA